MAEIGELEGINPGEVRRFCRANISTVEEFVSRLDLDLIYGLGLVFSQTGIKASRLLQLLPPDQLVLSTLPDVWVEELAERALRDAAPDDTWIRRCVHGLEGRVNRLRGNWGGWKENLPIFGLAGVMLIMIGLTLRAAGGLQWLPYPLRLRDRVLVTADTMEAGRVLKSVDSYAVLLPLANDYFKPDEKLDGLILARRVSGQTPLRFRDVLRQQVIASKDIQADAPIQKEDVTLAWAPYQPGSALSLEEVYGRKVRHSIRKDMAILSEFINP